MSEQRIESVTAEAPCPFCAKPLETKRGKINPYARCITPGCFGNKMPVVSLDVLADVEAWNTRTPSQPAASGGDVKLVYVKRWRTIVKLPAQHADEIVEALRTPSQPAASGGDDDDPTELKIEYDGE